MISTSSAYKTQIKESGHFPEFAAELHFADSTVLELISADFMATPAPQISFGTSRPGVFDVGIATMKTFSCLLNNFSGKFDGYDFSGAVFYPKEGLTLTDTTVEYLTLGKFTVDECERLTKTIRIVAVDDMYKLEKPYADGHHVCPATVEEMLEDICTRCSVTWDASPLLVYGNLILGDATNDDFIIDGTCDAGAQEIGGAAFDEDFGTFTNADMNVAVKPYGEGLTYRDVLSWICTLACCNAWFTPAGVLHLGWYAEHALYDIDTYRPNPSVSLVEYEISGLQYEPFDALPELWGDTTGWVYSIDSNQLLADDTYLQMMDALSQALIGFKFRPFTVSAFADFSVEAGDTVCLVTPEGTRYTTIVTNVIHSHATGSEVYADAEAPTANMAGTYSTEAKMRAIAASQTEIKMNAYEEKMMIVSAAINTARGFYETRTYADDGITILELYQHDAATVGTSTYVTKYTAEGVGYSHDGGAHYTTVINSTGLTVPQLVARVVTADLIRAGKLESMTGDTYFDLDNDEIHLDGTVNGKSIVTELNTTEGFYVSVDGTKKIYIDTNGNASFSGDLVAAGGTFNGVVKVNGETEFASGYDPSAKNTVFNQASQPTATKAGDIWVDTDANNKVYVWSGSAWIDALGIMAYEDAVEVSKLGTTVIDGGYIKTGLVDASRIDTGVLNAARVAIGATSTYASGYDPTLIAVGGRNLALGTEIDAWGVYSADTSLYRSTVNVTNLVTNGNFVNTTGWSASEGSLSVADNTVTHTSNGSQTYARITRTDSVSTAGHTYALTLRVRVTNSSCTGLSARIYNGATVTIQANPVENQWYQITALQTVTNAQSYIWITHNYATAGMAMYKKMEVQYVSCVDLTAHFPVTVPTKSVYARWIATQPHAWIDGTANTKGLYRTNSISAVSTVTGSGKSLGMQQSAAYRTMKLTEGATYTISVLARGNANVNLNACFVLNAGASNQALTTSWQMTAAWQKFYVTFTADANTGASTGSHLLFRYYGDVVAYSTWFEIQEVKIEAGNKATDWCPDTLDMAFPDTTTIDGGNIKTGKIESHDGKTYFDLDGDEVFVEGTIDGKVVTVEMSAESPFCLSQEDDNGVMQKLIYVTDDTGFSGPNILVTSRYDINEDGKVDYKDVEAIDNYALKMPYTPGVAWPNGFPSFSRMDMNGDGMVSSSDATYWSIGANVPDRITLGNRMLGLDYVGVWASDDSGATKTYIHTF